VAFLFAKIGVRAHDIDPRSFDAMLCRLAEGESGGDGDGDDDRFDFLSSHPPTSQRAQCATPPVAE
jgi:hypothetical protein